MIRKSGRRFSEKIMLHQKFERYDDSKKSHPALVLPGPPEPAKVHFRNRAIAALNELP
jgi:hypothetical protein